MAAGTGRTGALADIGADYAAEALDRNGPWAAFSWAMTKTINLALQGGGAHGAFTWGVLDRLLEDARIAFEGISATSAGAMNAAVLAHGLAAGGREGARAALAGFWRGISEAAVFSPLQPTPIERIFGSRALDYSPAFVLFDWVTRLLSPYRLNPANYNPLRQILARSIDCERLRQACPVKLFISATNVRAGKIKVFENRDMSIDAVLASACVPFLFQAVEIDGEAYWDGGYMGNPAIFPLIYGCESRDVVIVHVNPLNRAEVPTTAAEILNRVNEISFNSSLMREMRAISFVTNLVDGGMIQYRTLKRMLIHSIADEATMSELSVASKLNADWGFLGELHRCGRDCASTWLAANFDRLGEQSTIDMRAIYL